MNDRAIVTNTIVIVVALLIAVLTIVAIGVRQARLTSNHKHDEKTARIEACPEVENVDLCIALER